VILSVSRILIWRQYDEELLKKKAMTIVIKRKWYVIVLVMIPIDYYYSIDTSIREICSILKEIYCYWRRNYSVMTDMFHSWYDIDTFYYY